MKSNLSRTLLIAAAVFAIVFFVSADAGAQGRDYMTDAEIELVRDAQDIDVRVEVLSKMIDRRFLAAGLNSNGWAEPSKGSEKWGPVPTGTKLELLSDIRRLLQKAIDDIDDVAEHNDNALTQNKTDGELFPKAVRSLGASAQRYHAVLAPLAEKTKDEKEKGVIYASIESCEQIIAAVAKLPPDTKKRKKT